MNKLTIHELDGAVLHYSDVIHKFPSRKDLLDQKLVKTVQNRINKRQVLRFRSDDLFEKFLLVKDNAYSTSMYAKRYYCIILNGVLEDNRFQTVVITGIKPYFEIRIPKEYSSEKRDDMMLEAKTFFATKGVKYDTMEMIEGTDFRGYNYKCSYIKCSFNTDTARRWALKLIMDNCREWKTRHNDLYNYHRVIFRDLGISTTVWMNLKKYTIESSSTIPFIKQKEIIVIDYNNLEQCLDDPIEDPILKNDPGLVFVWDIECGSGSGELPMPENPSDDIFMINGSLINFNAKIFPTDADPVTDIPSGNYKFPKPKGHLLNIGITTDPVPEMPNRCNIVAKDEKEALIIFAIIWAKFRPQYEAGFNSFNFDWHWVYERAKQYKILGLYEDLMSVINFKVYNEYSPKYKTLPESVYHYKKFIFKVSADLSVDGRYLKYPGYMSIDVKPQLRRLFNNPEKNSLNNYLKIKKLGQKADLPIKLMFKTHKGMKAFNEKYINKPNADICNLHGYSNDFVIKVFRLAGRDDLADRYENLLYAMTFVAEYCFIDGIKCFDLLKTTNFISDKRAQGEYGFVSMEDCINRADGMKVINLVFNKCHKYGYHTSSAMGKKIDFKYPGAKVFEPLRKEIKPRLNIEERIQRAIDGDYDYVEWTRYDTPEHIQRFKDWIRDNDAWLGYLEPDTNPADKKTIDNLVANYPKCFVEMLNENPETGETALDFNSLYPSIIMEKNLSLEKKIDDALEALEIKKEGKHKINLVDLCFSNQMKIKTWMVHHGMTKFSDPQDDFGIYPRILRELFVDRKKIKKVMGIAGHRKEVLEDIVLLRRGGDKSSPDKTNTKSKSSANKFDPYAYKQMLEDKLKNSTGENITTIFDEWDEYELKHLVIDAIKKCDDALAGILSEKEQKKKDQAETDANRSIEELEAEIEVLDLKYNYLYSKQLALKIFMNTFYGKAGESGSPLFDLAVAAGTTARGQEHVIALSEWLINVKGSTRLYGDTDSVYFMFNQRYFRKIHRGYYSGQMSKLTYMKKIINMCIIKSLEYEKEVNQYFIERTGGPFIRVSWEEVGYPSIHMGKKKYVMIPHEKLYPMEMTDDEFYLKFKSIKLFIRGIEIKKKGNSQLLQDIGRDIWKKSFDPYNTTPLINIVEKKIEEVYTNPIRNESDFIMTAAYKPNKQNMSVLLFVDRMKQVGLGPEPFERFRYVMTRKYPWAYDIKGRKRDLKVGERMEYPWRAKELGMPIDMDYYMTGKIKGELARYIRYHPSLHIPPTNTDDDDECHDCDEKSVKNAKKHIDIICAKFSKKYVDKGPIYKMLYKETTKSLDPHLTKMGWNSHISSFNSDTTEYKKKVAKSAYDQSLMSKQSNDEIFDRFIKTAESFATKEAKKSAKLKVKKMFDSKTGKLHTEYLLSTKSEKMTFTKSGGIKTVSKDDNLQNVIKLVKSYEYVHELKYSMYEVIKNNIYLEIRRHINIFRKILDRRDEIVQNTIDKLLDHYNIGTVSDDIVEDLMDYLSSIKQTVNKNINTFIPEELDDVDKDDLCVDILNDLWVKLMIYSKSFNETREIIELLKSKKKNMMGLF